MRLKSRTEWPPGGGFQLLLPEIGMKTAFVGGFKEVVHFFAGVVIANPSAAQKYHWPTDNAGQEAFVDERECRRLLASGYPSFVDVSVAPMPTVWNPEPVKKNLLGRVVAVAHATKAGIGVWLDMFGPSGKPVDQVVAERRADRCVNCPQNNPAAKLEEHLIESAVRGISFIYQMQRDLKLQTSQDENLGMCNVCLCPLKAKVQVEMTHILKHLTPEVKAELPSNCWILDP